MCIVAKYRTKITITAPATDSSVVERVRRTRHDVLARNGAPVEPLERTAGTAKTPLSGPVASGEWLREKMTRSISFFFFHDGGRPIKN